MRRLVKVIIIVYQLYDIRPYLNLSSEFDPNPLYSINNYTTIFVRYYYPQINLSYSFNQSVYAQENKFGSTM